MCVRACRYSYLHSTSMVHFVLKPHDNVSSIQLGFTCKYSANTNHFSLTDTLSRFKLFKHFIYLQLVRNYVDLSAVPIKLSSVA